MDDEYENYNIIVDLVMTHMGWDMDHTLTWMNMENPLLGGVSPMQMVLMGRSSKLLSFVQACIDESKPYEKE